MGIQNQNQGILAQILGIQDNAAGNVLGGALSGQYPPTQVPGSGLGPTGPGSIPFGLGASGGGIPGTKNVL
jgi:hypothetical protein